MMAKWHLNFGRLMRLILVAVALGSATAWAQFPGRPVSLILPFPPGGSADLIARSVAQAMGLGLGQPIIVENRAGADGMIAGEAVMKAVPDGYTLMFATNTPFNAALVMHKNAPYDPLVDFTPIGEIGNFGFFVFVNNSVPAKTLRQLFDFARANPGKLAYGSGNSTSIVATARLAREAGVNMVQVPYKGDAPMTLDLLAGRIQVAVATGTLMPHAKDGNLRILATLLPTRAALLPDVPTLPEAGASAMPMKSWAGLFGPAKMPPAVVDRLAKELVRALAQPDVREQLEKLAFAPQSSSPGELGELLRDQMDIWRKAGKEAGIATQ